MPCTVENVSSCVPISGLECSYGNNFQLGYRDVIALHMSPVDRAGSVSEILPHHSFLYKNFDMFYEKAGWPGYRDLRFCNRYLGPARFIIVRLMAGEAINKKLCDKVLSLTLVRLEPGSSLLVNGSDKPNIHSQESMLRLNGAAVKKILTVRFKLV